MNRLCLVICLLLIGCGGVVGEAEPTPAQRLTAALALSPTIEQRLTDTATAEAPDRSRLTAMPADEQASNQRLTVTSIPTQRPVPNSQLPTPATQPAPPAWSYPIGMPGESPGDGFFVRHGFQVENTWFNPGYWHTGEDWYAIEGDTAGAEAYSVADGEVVYVDSNYPGRVVIVRHADDLFSMYGHLAFEPPVAAGQPVSRGDLLGTVLRRSDNVPNHLHFEIRAFLTTPEVNGDAPRYAFRCGRQYPPGPGYWPIGAPDLPSALGWLNPSHAIAHRAMPGEVIVVRQPASEQLSLWAEVDERGEPREHLGDLQLVPGNRYPLLSQRIGPDAPATTSAESYQLWYRIALPNGRAGWVEAAVASDFETGSDGRPATVRFNFVPENAAR